MDDADVVTPDDEALLAELRDAAERHDPMPDRLLNAARGSFAWLTIDAELAVLANDSAYDEDLATVRAGGTAGPRDVTFETPSLTVEVEVTVVGDRRRIVAQVIPAAEVDVEVRTPSGVTAVRTDAMGRLPTVEVPAGLVSLRVGGTVTEWVRL